MKNFKCKKCSFEYKTKNGLKKHIKEKHSIIAVLKKYKWILTALSIIVGILIFWNSYKPDLEIDGSYVDWNNLKYIYTLTNYGNSKASNIEIYYDLNYFEGQLIKLQFLGPGKSRELVFDATAGNIFLDDVKEILAGNKGAVVNIRVTYKWMGIRFDEDKYIGTISIYGSPSLHKETE